VVNFTLLALYSRERIPVPIEQVYVWAPESYGSFGEDIDLFAPAGIRTMGRAANSQDPGLCV
jgi:hypothetical protein